MSEPEVESKSVSVVGLIEAYKAAQEAYDSSFKVYCSTSKARREDTIEIERLIDAFTQAHNNLLTWLEKSESVRAVSHCGTTYFTDEDTGMVSVIEPVREATEIAAESGESAL